MKIHLMQTQELSPNAVARSNVSAVTIEDEHISETGPDHRIDQIRYHGQKGAGTQRQGAGMPHVVLTDPRH